MLEEKKLIENWLDFLKNNKRYSLNTIESYRFDIQDLYKFNFENLKKKSISEFNSEEIYDWLLKRKNENAICSRSNSRAISALKNFLNFLITKKLLNISDELFFLKMPKFLNKLPKTVTKNEIKFSNILKLGENKDWFEIQDGAIIMLMYGSGLRISEVLSITINDINFDEMFLTIRNAKNKKERIVPLIKPVFDMFLKHIFSCPFLNIRNIFDNLNYEKELKNYKEYKSFLKKISNFDNLFFCLNGNKMTRNYFALKLKKLLPAYNLPYGTSSHSFRHSFASHLLENGANIKQIQNLLGHSRLSSSEIYTKVNNNLLRKMYNSAHPKLK